MISFSSKEKTPSGTPPKEKASTIISAVIGDLTFSSSSVYVWVRLNQQHYEFSSDTIRERQANSISLALANLLSSEEKEISCQLIVTTRKFNVNAWHDALLERAYKDGTPTEEFPDYLNDMAEHIYDFDFDQRRTYVGIKIGERREYTPIKTNATTVPFLNDLIDKMTAQVDEYITDKELEYWNSKANLIRHSLYESELGANKVETAELIYIITKNFHPNMPTPSIEEIETYDSVRWGKGEIDTLTNADIINKTFWLQINQIVDGEEHTGYRATLSFAKFPDSYVFPAQEPWIHSTAGLGVPVEFYSRFDIVPSKKVKKQVGNKIKEIQDQVYNQTSAGGSISLEMQDKFDQGQELEFQLGKDDTPWLYGRHHITVEAGSEKELKENCQEIIDHYKGLGILVVWSAGDQLDLLLEELPGEKIRMNAYYQRHQLGIIGVGIPNGGGTAGDNIDIDDKGKKKGWIGPYMGYTTSRVLEPVFISIHSAINRNNPPTLVITGAPGSGKSFCAFTLTANMVISGTQVVLIDPKGEAGQLADIPGMGKPMVVDLQDSPDGMLDPFQMGETAAMKLDLALDTAYMLLGGKETLSPKAEAELIKAIRIVIKNKYPSMVKLKEILKHVSSEDGRALGERLDLISELPMSNLCFSNASKKQSVQSLHMSKTLTVISLKNLDMPASTTRKEDYSMKNTLAVALLFLITSFAKNLMIQPNTKDSHAKDKSKAIVVDEAWAITSTQQGAKLIESVARLGRSANTGLILVSQNAKDFLGGAVTNSVSMKLAFKANSPEEVKDVIHFFNLEENVGNEEVISGLGPGQCLLSDADQRIARIQIDGWNAKISRAIETNPDARRENAREDLESKPIEI